MRISKKVTSGMVLLRKAICIEYDAISRTFPNMFVQHLMFLAMSNMPSSLFNKS